MPPWQDQWVLASRPALAAPGQTNSLEQKTPQSQPSTQGRPQLAPKTGPTGWERAKQLERKTPQLWGLALKRWSSPPPRRERSCWARIEETSFYLATAGRDTRSEALIAEVWAGEGA